MDKTAQKRRALNKMREWLNAPTEKLMGKFSPQFIDLMDQLRTTDDNVREKAEGLKNLLKLARTNYNRREYMDAVYFLGQFRDRMEEIFEALKGLGREVDIKHHEFLFGDMDQEHLDYLTNKLSPKLEKQRALLKQLLSKQPASKKADQRAILEKEAWVGGDIWHNLTSSRGRSMAAWEKRFPRKARELRKQIDGMINKSKQLLDILLSSLKSMATARATRSLEDYLRLADKFNQKYKTYDATFSLFYDTSIKNLVATQKEVQEKKQQAEQIEQTNQEEQPEHSDAEQPIQKSEFSKIKEWQRQHPGEKITPEVIQALRQSSEEEQKPAQKSKLEVPVEAPAPELTLQQIPLPEAFQAPKTPRMKNTPPATRPMTKKVEDWFMPPSNRGFPTPTPQSLALIQKDLPQTEHDIGPTILSPPLHTQTINPISPKIIEPVSSVPTEPENIFELSEIPDTLEETEISPRLNLPIKERPLQVSMVPSSKTSYTEFLNKLEVLGDDSPIALSLFIMKYANQIQENEPEISQKLLQLSKQLVK